MGYEATYTEKEFLPKIKNLDLSTPEGRKKYDEKRYDYISLAEGVKPKAYKDTKGYVSVGIGFNMDRKEARAEWNLAFQCLPAASRPDFDQVYNKSRLLTLTEIRILYDYSITSREKELRTIYGKSGFDYFTPGERITIEEEFYNGPKITGQKTNFAKHAKAYIKAKMEGKM